MTLLHKIGTFTKPGSGTTGSQAITGVGFQPKILLLVSGGQTALNTTLQADITYTVGMGTAAAEVACGRWFADDTLASSDASQYFSNTAIFVGGNANAPTCVATLTSFDSDGFTLNWTSNTAAAHYIGYIAIAGTDILNAKLVNYQMIAEATSTLTGAGFTPSAAFYMASGNTSYNTTEVHARHSLGCVKGSNEYTLGFSIFDGQGTGDSARSYSSSAFNIHGAPGAIDGSAAVTLQSDGASLGWTNQATANQTMAWLYVEIVNTAFMQIPAQSAKPTGAAPATQQYTGIAYTPEFVFFFGDNVATTALTADVAYSFGVDDGTNRWSINLTDDDGAANMVTKSAFNASWVQGTFTPATPTIDAQATAAMTSVGWDLTWNPNDANAWAITHWIWGQAPSGILRQMMMHHGG